MSGQSSAGVTVTLLILAVPKGQLGPFEGCACLRCMLPLAPLPLEAVWSTGRPRPPALAAVGRACGHHGRALPTLARTLFERIGALALLECDAAALVRLPLLIVCLHGQRCSLSAAHRLLLIVCCSLSAAHRLLLIVGCSQSAHAASATTPTRHAAHKRMARLTRFSHAQPARWACPG
jgi:hypothetical protein